MCYTWKDSDEATKTLKFCITQAKSNNVTVSIQDWTYGDDPKKPSATADFGADNVVYSYSDKDETPKEHGIQILCRSTEEVGQYL